MTEDWTVAGTREVCDVDTGNVALGDIGTLAVGERAVGKRAIGVELDRLVASVGGDERGLGRFIEGPCDKTVNVESLDVLLGSLLLLVSWDVFKEELLTTEVAAADCQCRVSADVVVMESSEIAGSEICDTHGFREEFPAAGVKDHVLFNKPGLEAFK